MRQRHRMSFPCGRVGGLGLASVRDTGRMDDAASADPLSHARDLERQDGDVAARLDHALDVLRQVDAVRAETARIEGALAALPLEIEQVEATEREAREREAEARIELADAARRLEEVSRSWRAGEDVKALAERAHTRAEVSAADAAEALVRLGERLAVLSRRELELRAEAEAVAVEAERVAGVVAEVPRLSASGRSRPGPSLDEIDEWGARAHAALFVVRSGLETERERLVHEANVLAAVNLGDQGGVASVALLRKRIEESLRAG